MLKSNSKEKIYTIPMPIDKTYKLIVSRKINTRNIESIIITGINEKEYKLIKEGKDINIVRGDFGFNISSNNVICFGIIDFNNNSEDCEILDGFDWFNKLIAKGIDIPSKYNYEKHECSSPIKHCLWTETFKISTYCKYLHGCLGKPALSLIFRQIK